MTLWGCTVLGLGVGLAFNNPAVGVLIGTGIGFLFEGSRHKK